MMDRFITDSLKSILLSSKFFRNKLNIFFLFLITFLIKNITDAVFYMIFKRDNPYIDFVVSVSVTVSIEFVSPIFVIVLRRYKQDLLVFTEYVIDEMTHEKLDRIKKIFIFSLSISVIIILQFVEVTSFYLVHTISCFLTSFFIIDNIKKYKEKQGWLFNLKNRISSSFNRPEITGEDLSPILFVNEGESRIIPRMKKRQYMRNMKIEENISFEEEEIN